MTYLTQSNYNSLNFCSVSDRPGRLGKLLYVPLPCAADRVSILEALTRNIAIDLDPASPGHVDLNFWGNDVNTNGFSGADLAALVREAAMAVVKNWTDEQDNDDLSIKTDDECHQVMQSHHFREALSKVHPSVSFQDRLRYRRIHEHIQSGMGAIEALQAVKT